jgi:hypothetical protein
MADKLSRDQMLVLVGRIFRAEGTEMAADADIALFVANCAHPSKTDILFWPELVPELAGRVPTAEEVVDLAMNGGAGAQDGLH